MKKIDTILKCLYFYYNNFHDKWKTDICDSKITKRL